MTSIIPSNGQSPFDALRQIDQDGEFWIGRTLQPVMGYSRWEDFHTVLMKASDSLELVQGESAALHHFGRTRSEGGRWGNQILHDFRLTRFGAYLAAMAGDDTKEEVARARVYFAVKTREAETRPAPVEMTKLEALQAAIESEQGRLAAEARVAELEPVARSWQVLASGDGDFSVADAAKILGRDPSITLGRNRLFAVLAEHRWTYRQGADDKPRAMQTAVTRGWLSELPQSYEHPRTGELVLAAPQVRVTLKGLHELHKRLGGTGAVVVPASIQGGAR